MDIKNNSCGGSRLLKSDAIPPTIHGEIRDAVVLSGVTSVNGKTGVIALMAGDVGAVSYQEDQNLSEEQKRIARENIDAIDLQYVNTRDNIKWNRLGQDEGVTILLTGGNH